ncbi:MAG: serine hydrolase domain-containing protein, partial [Ilumatobacteraceae bacterium]
MQALQLIDSWPVDNAATAVVDPAGSVHTQGDQDRRFRVASVAKTVTTWACLVAVEEGIVALDQPVGQPGCTLRHLLSHAGGYPFDGPLPIARPERTRIYSNTGIEMAAQAVEQASGITFTEYLDEAVLSPLGMASTTLRGSPAHRLWSTAADLTRFVHELDEPQLISTGTAQQAVSVQFPDLCGIIPGL